MNYWEKTVRLRDTDALLVTWMIYSYCGHVHCCFPSLNHLICGLQGDEQPVMISVNMKKLFPPNMAALFSHGLSSAAPGLSSKPP